MKLRADGMGWKALAIAGALTLMVADPAAADDLTTTDGKTYAGITVTKVEPDGISITHATGSAKVPFTKLPEELQKKHGYDAEKSEAYLKEQAKRRAELDAMLRESREKEAALQRANQVDSFTVTPALGEGISLKMQSRAQVKEERIARWRMELFREDEIKEMLAESPPQARLLVMWKRADYDAAAAENFRVIISKADGTVRSRTDLEYRSPKQTEQGEYMNANGVDLNEVPDEFRVRVVDGNLKVFADFVVRRVK